MKPPCDSFRHGSTALAGAAWLLVLAVVGSIPSAASAQAPPPPIDQQIVNQRPRFLVRAWVDRQYAIYAEGESLTLKVRSEEDAYLYILYQQADGKVFQIFPNRGQPDNRIKAMKDVQVPDVDDGFRWIVGTPLGVEVIKVIASKQPIDALSIPGLREDHFNPVSGEQINAASQQVGKEPANAWSEHDIKIQTVAKGVSTTPPPASKRVGVFFGVSDYEFNEPHMQAQRDFMKEEGKVDEERVRPLSLICPMNDARDLARVLQDVGQLSESKVFVNNEVTRAKMQEVITQWLPSVTKPGDTVFIFFSGHGSQIEDDDGDEKDGLDEILSPYESMSLNAFDVLLKRSKAGQLVADLNARVQNLFALSLDVFRRVLAQFGGPKAPGAEEKASRAATALIERQTAISDDDMGHWVQKLDGRRVVVILDACRSGGMARIENKGSKGFDDGPRARKRFDFLSGEFSRLKDLDQPTLTVMTAAGEQQNSAEFIGARNGMFTGALIKLLKSSSGPVDARNAAEFATKEIADQNAKFATVIDLRIQAHPEQREMLEKQKETFAPVYFTTDPKPIYLKP